MWNMWMRWFSILAMPSFFGIGGGPGKREKEQYGALSSLANFATSQGERDILASNDFWNAILSGDPTQISKVLGPEISGVNRRAKEAKKTTAEFGNRGGGTNAFMQMTDANARSSIDSLIGQLTGTAAGTLGSTGTGLLGIGESGHVSAFNAAEIMQEQSKAQWDDLFKGITSVASALIPGKWGQKIGSIGG